MESFIETIKSWTSPVSCWKTFLITVQERHDAMTGCSHSRWLLSLQLTFLKGLYEIRKLIYKSPRRGFTGAQKPSSISSGYEEREDPACLLIQAFNGDSVVPHVPCGGAEYLLPGSPTDYCWSMGLSASPDQLLLDVPFEYKEDVQSELAL